MIKKFLLFSMLLFSLAACAGVPASPAAEISTLRALPATLSASPAFTQTQAPSATPPEPTATSTPSQPVLDPARLGDLGKLKSYVIKGQYLKRSGTLSTDGGEFRHSS